MLRYTSGISWSIFLLSHYCIIIETLAALASDAKSESVTDQINPLFVTNASSGVLNYLFRLVLWYGLYYP